MKKILALILLLVLIVSLSACGKVEITMQEIYDAGLTETMLKNHQSVYIRDEMDGALYCESHLTKDYAFVRYEIYEWAEFLTDDAYYNYFEGDYSRVLPITPDGIIDIASFRASHYNSLLFATDTVDETIESVSKKDGRITVKSFFDQETLENMAGVGLTSGNFEYVLDAKNRELITAKSNDTYEDGASYSVISEVSYDTEAPEMVKVFLEYVNQTENLRNVTIVTNPGTEQEISQSIQAPKGLFAEIYSAYESETECELYTDAACTEVYDPYADTDSDLTVYVKWTE